MIDYCRKYMINNEQQLNKVIQFEREYQQDTVIPSYTANFLYEIINKAFGDEDIDI